MMKPRAVKARRLAMNLARDCRLHLARRLYDALCAQNPNRFITLFDQHGACVSAHSARPDAPTVEAPICTAPI
jgi:hypothetical protein